jgi:hypothetical protein
MNNAVRVTLVLSLFLVASLPASALSCRVCTELGCVNSQQVTDTRCAPVQNPADCRTFEDYSCTAAPPEFALVGALSVVSIEIIEPSERRIVVSGHEEVAERKPAAGAPQK